MLHIDRFYSAGGSHMVIDGSTAPDARRPRLLLPPALAEGPELAALRARVQDRPLQAGS